MYLMRPADCQHTRFARASGGGILWRTGFFGPAPSPQGADSVRPEANNALVYAEPAPGERREPQAFLVEQSPGAPVHPHFHFVDQFQVVVEGEGSLGRHPVAPYTVHFAGAHTGYGPITPGASGLKYFTLRATEDRTGAQYLPANRHKMADRARRNIVFDAIEPLDRAALAALGAPRAQRQQRDADGPVIDVLALPPGTLLELPAGPPAGGQALIVLEGELRSGERCYERLSCGFRAPGEAAPAFSAGDCGAQVLVLGYPAASGQGRVGHAA